MTAAKEKVLHTGITGDPQPPDRDDLAPVELAKIYHKNEPRETYMCANGNVLINVIHCCAAITCVALQTNFFQPVFN